MTTDTKPEPSQADPARAAIAADHQAKRKPDPFIDRAVELFQGSIDLTIPVDAVLKDAYDSNPTPAAVMGFLKQAKADGRLTITGIDGVNVVSLTDQSVAIEKVAPHVTAPAEIKTVEQHLAEAQGRPTSLPFEVSIGSWVYDRGEAQPAKITGMQTNGVITIYEVRGSNGKKRKDVVAWDLERLPESDLQHLVDAEQLAKLRKHNQVGQNLAQMLADEEAVEVQQSGDLKATRKRIDNLREKIDAHLMGVPVDGQQEIDLADDGSQTISGKPPWDAYTTPADRLLARIVGKDIIELTGGNQPWDKLDAATLKAEHSTGKPPTVEPLSIAQAPGGWVCVDIQDGVAVLLRAYNRKEWVDFYGHNHGEPRDIPSQELTAKAEAGGKWMGFPIKVGRKTMYLASLDEALLVKLP